MLRVQFLSSATARPEVCSLLHAREIKCQQKRCLTFFFSHFLCSTLLYVYHLNKNTMCYHRHSNTDHWLCCRVLPPSKVQINNITQFRTTSVLNTVHNLAAYHKITCRNTLLVLRYTNILGFHVTSEETKFENFKFLPLSGKSYMYF